jgi:hypothetical protein
MRALIRLSGIKALLVRSNKDDLPVSTSCAGLAVTHCYLAQRMGEPVPVSVKSKATVLWHLLAQGLRRRS